MQHCLCRARSKVGVRVARPVLAARAPTHPCRALLQDAWRQLDAEGLADLVQLGLVAVADRLGGEGGKGCAGVWVDPASISYEMPAAKWLLSCLSLGCTPWVGIDKTSSPGLALTL